MSAQIAHVPVESSNIKSVGYDPQSQTLEVVFHGGRVYRYAGVPPDAHEALMAAPSKGRHFAAHIRPRHQAERRDNRPPPAAPTGS